MKKLLISVVILNYNKPKETLKSIGSLLAQTYKNFEIIIVDDASTDDSILRVKEKFPQVKLIALKKSLGRSAHNIGLRNAKGDILVIMDSDMYASKNFLRKIAEKFNKYSKLDSLAFNLKDPSGKTVGWQPVYDPKDKMGNGLRCASGFPTMRRKIFNEVGGFNPKIFLYVDEWEYFIRILKAGFKSYYFPDIIAYHTSPETPYKPIMRGYHVVKNHMQVYALYLPICVWFKFLNYHTKEFTKVIATGSANRWGTVKGLITGLWFFIKALPDRDVLKGENLRDFMRFYFPRKGDVIVTKWGWKK